MKNKIIVFIPSYRCDAQIKRVLYQFSDEVQNLIDAVLIVDNRSPDSTMQTAINSGKAVLKNCNFVVLENTENYGLGGSHKVAFIYALEHGYDYLVVLHGDDQADILDLVPQLKARAYLDVDCLLGARFMRGSQLKGYSLLRTVGNRVYNHLFSIVSSSPIYDLGSGLNLYCLEAFRSLYFNKFPDDLTFNYVMLLASFYRKQRVRFFPISWREEDQRSNVKLFRQALKVLGLLASFAFNRCKFLESDLRTRSFDAYKSEVRYRHEKQST